MKTIKQYSFNNIDEGLAIASSVLAGLESYPLALDPKFLKVFQRSLDHKPYLLIQFDGDQPIQFLALAHVKSRLFGAYLVSLPFLNYGGVIGSGGLDPAPLLLKAESLAASLGVRHLELRNQTASEYEKYGKLSLPKLNALRPLAATSEETWDSLKGTVRNRVRKAKKLGLTAEWGRMNQLDCFYEIFAINMRDLGTPVYPRSLFEEILKTFPENTEICTVKNDQGTPLASSFVMHGKGVSEVPSVSALREYNNLNPNMLLYWEMLAKSLERGQKVFDFGRCTPDSGPHRFKKTWGAELTVAPWRYYVLTGSPESMRRENPKHRFVIETWKHLPLGVTKFFGPKIVRGIP